MKILADAQMEMNAIVAERRVLAALNNNIPAAADRVYSIGEEVLVFDENKKEWIGPFMVIEIDDKQITVETHDKSHRQTFSCQHLKPYFRDLPETDYRLDPDEFFFEMTKPFRSNSRPQAPLFDVHLTEVIKNGDPLATDPKFDEAKGKEIEGLIKRGTWKIVCKAEMPKGTNVLGGRFVLAIEEEGTEDEIWKARFVVQGFRDGMKTSLVNNTATGKQHSTRILVGLAAMVGFRLFSTDVTQAYLQSAENVLRDVYLNPSKEFELGPEATQTTLRFSR